MRFAGKAALITGAAGGIGRAVTGSLLAEGATVVLADLKEEALRDLVERAGGRALAVAADVSVEGQVKELAQKALSFAGRLDFLINCCGIYPRTAFAEITEEEWDRVMEVNLTATFLCCREAARVMQPGGRIVNFSSDLARRGSPRGAHYAASKAGVMGFTRSLARELAGQGITVNAVAPGVIDTEMTRRGRTEQEFAAKAGEIPLGRVGRPADVAGIVLYLLSEEAAYITGQTIHINGGTLMP